jgi:transcriptional regulator with XRE-family HTH domain
MGERQTTWGINISTARKGRGLTQQDLADKLDPAVTQATIARWESGSVTIPDDRRIQVADVLNIEPIFLFPMIRERAS